MKEKEREKEKRMTKSASVTDPVRIKRLLEKSQEENALLMQQIKELQLRYEKEQEKCQAHMAKTQQLEKNLGVVLAEREKLEVKMREEVEQIKQQTIEAKRSSEESLLATHQEAMNEQRDETERLRGRLFAALHALEQNGIDPDTLKPVDRLENLATAFKPDFNARLRLLREVVQSKKESLQANIDHMYQLNETLSSFESTL